MATCSVKNAQDSLNELLSDAHKGKTVLVTAENGWAVKLVPMPIRAKKRRKAGSARGQVWMSADFDEPLDDFADYVE